MTKVEILDMLGETLVWDIKLVLDSMGETVTLDEDCDKPFTGMIEKVHMEVLLGNQWWNASYVAKALRGANDEN